MVFGGMQCCQWRLGGGRHLHKGGGRGQRWQGAAVADGEVALLLAGASADALGGKMVMDSASNIERGSKMIIALRGKQR